jgi:lactoylglutathione lyase
VKFIHAMIRVRDEARSVEFYSNAFAMAVSKRIPRDGFTLTYLRNAENSFEIELTINHDQAEPYTHGSGYGHLAVSAADIRGEWERLTALGCEPTPIKDFNEADGALIARFFFVTDPDGYKIEVLERQGHYL